jgi:two-component system, OmpR family, sensor histidine kinase MtrB
MVTFGVGAFLLISLFASLTYVGVRSLLTTNRVDLDLRQGYLNAALVRSTLYSSISQLPNVLNSIETATGSQVLVRTHSQWLSHSQGATTGIIPQSMIHDTNLGEATYATRLYNQHVYFVIGIPLPSVETQVYQVFPLDNLEHQLSLLVWLLAVGAAVTSLLGLLAGLWFARRSVKPLRNVASAAEAITHGSLETRLPEGEADREVDALTRSFNAMVEQLVDRMERDARFASDVSHELRSPLTTLATSASVLQMHRDELDAAGQESLDLLVADLAIFQGLVEDLLEMARSDAGTADVTIEYVEAVELVRRCVASAIRRHALPDVPVVVDDSVNHPIIAVDRRRFERIITNLVDNAHRYAHGATAVRLSQSDRLLAICVDDAGPGIADEERDLVFDRFFRGRNAHLRGAARGSGLGLALVKEHVKACNGTIHVGTSPEGGARFEIVVPIVEVD